MGNVLNKRLINKEKKREYRMEKKPKVKNNWKIIAFAVVGGGAILFKVALKIGKLYAIHNWIDKMFS